MRIKSESTGAQRFENESNDCTVRALANVLGAPYKLAHKIMAAAGRKQNHGMGFDDWHPVYTRLGLRLVSLHGTTNGARYISKKLGIQAAAGTTLANLLPSLRDGRYLLKYRGHVFAVVNGKVLDYGDNPAGTRIQAVYKLDKQAVLFDQQ
jgi:hypothetical protein